MSDKAGVTGAKRTARGRDQATRRSVMFDCDQPIARWVLRSSGRLRRESSMRVARVVGVAIGTCGLAAAAVAAVCAPGPRGSAPTPAGAHPGAYPGAAAY